MPTTIECDWRGGEPEQRRLHWRPGEWSIDSPTHYVRHHERGEAWLRGGAQFWASYHRTLETTTLAYYLTGDERYNDVIEYWRAYFGELAGVTSASTDAKPWYREQAWFRPSNASQSRTPAKTWAEMIRDYAPFHSGTRHQMTMFFNLATLYEHTWDPQVGQALQECADAFLDPMHPTGTWRPQDSDLPAHADVPSMGHFWVPALWKYSRVTNDPRMPDILSRYFTAGYAADPFRAHETVGVYSNSYLGYAYYSTRDPRFLPLIAKELNQLMPYAEPLRKPSDIGERLYNPYAPARTFAGVPRLIWALDAARRDSVKIGPPPSPPQRTAIAIHKSAGMELTATIWGFDQQLTLLNPAGKPFRAFRVRTTKAASEVQPFDRILPNYEVFLHLITIPAEAEAGVYVIVPHLELAVLDWNSDTPPCRNAARPLALHPSQTVDLLLAKDDRQLQLESAQATSLRLRSLDGVQHPGTMNGNTATFSIEGTSRAVRIEIETKPGWFQIVNRPEIKCWVSTDGPSTVKTEESLFGSHLSRNSQDFDPTSLFLPGRFGSAVQVVPKRALHIPDHSVEAGVERLLFDEKQGTIEFWVRQQWDSRLTDVPPHSLLTNGVLNIAHPGKLKLQEWTHIALVWAPYRGDPNRTITYTYIDGRDTAFYRSARWDGYSSARPSSGPRDAKRLMEFVIRAVAGTAYSIDELRVSKIARYADLQVEYGPQQTFNPVRFDPPSEPFLPDSNTLLLFHFDDDLKSTTPEQLPAARFGE